jgi:hypothetical protein
VNPNDERDYLVMAQLASTQRWKAEFQGLAEECNICVGANGKCQRDSIELTDTMYSRFRGAMRSNFSAERPARPVLYLDATGASLGRGITHAEIGSADFAGDCKQSRSTLAPAGLYEDSDKPIPIRENLDVVVPTYNKLIQRAHVLVEDAAGGDPKEIQAEPITSADMQVSTVYLHTSNCQL